LTPPDIIQRQGAPAPAPEPEEEEVQMKPMVQRLSTTGGTAATPDVEESIQQAKGSGQPLAENVREPMERAFGADFSGVKIHTDSKSDQLNQSIQARAFTTGQDLFFKAGEYNPGSKGGQELLAHELTHVVQQSGNQLLQSSSLSQVLSSPDHSTVQCAGKSGEFKDQSSLDSHYQKHVTTQNDAGDSYADSATYERAAIDIVNGGYDEQGNKGSKTYYWKNATGQFVVTNGTNILSMFVPSRGKQYFDDQIK
jgi:hypothetical protein